LFVIGVTRNDVVIAQFALPDGMRYDKPVDFCHVGQCEFDTVTAV